MCIRDSCWAVASPISGALSDKIGKRKPIYLGGCIVAVTGWSIVFYTNDLTLPIFIAVAAITSFASGAVVLGFAFSKESVPARFLGTISGTTNIGNMIGPALLQPGIGWILDKHWSGTILNGVHVYDLHAYRLGFVLMIGWLLISTLLLSFTKETYCKQSA